MKSFIPGTIYTHCLRMVGYKNGRNDGAEASNEICIHRRQSL